jgi:hypothetical protein
MSFSKTVKSGWVEDTINDSATERIRDLRDSPIFLPEDPDFSFFDEPVDPKNFFDGLTDRMVSISKEYELPIDLITPLDIEGVEVGDDRVDITLSSASAVSILAQQEATVGMKTSVEDTMISRESLNFCEVTTVIPRTRFGTYTRARKANAFHSMEYADAPALRTIIDTTKVETVHSTSSVGKSGMHGAKMKSSNSVCRPYLQVANIFQDALLNTCYMTEPKYMPQTLGGCGAPAPYEDPVNVLLYMRGYRGGGYDRIYGTAVEEAKEAIRLTEDGKPTPIILGRILRDNDEYGFATMRNYVLLPPSELRQTDEEGELPTPLYKGMGVKNEITSVEGRLIRARQLVTRTSALVLQNRKKKIEELLLNPIDITEQVKYDAIRQKRKTSAFLGALRGNSAFVNLASKKGSDYDVTKLIREEWKVCVTGQPTFSIDHADWLHNGAKGKTLSIVDLQYSEDMFLRSQVSEDESMKVAGITLDVEMSEGIKTQTTKAEIGLYQINSTMLEWADHIVSKLKETPEEEYPIRPEVITHIYRQDREWVNDDHALIGMAIDATKDLSNNAEVALISEDKRLANQMMIQANCRVILINPLSAYETFREKEWNSTTEITPDELFRGYREQKYTTGLSVPVIVLIDSGALLSILQNKERERKGGTDYMIELQPVSNRRLENGIREETFDRIKTPMERHLVFRIYDSRYKSSRTNRPKSGTYSSSTGTSSRSSKVSFDRGKITRRRPRILRGMEFHD